MSKYYQHRSAEYREDRERLRALFPRGRFAADQDGSCVLVARCTSRHGDKAFCVAAGRIFGVYFSGRGNVYLQRARKLLVRDLRGEQDGILWFKWDPALAKLFPWFCRPPARSIEALVRWRERQQSAANGAKSDQISTQRG